MSDCELELPFQNDKRLIQQYFRTTPFIVEKFVVLSKRRLHLTHMKLLTLLRQLIVNALCRDEHNGGKRQNWTQLEINILS